KIEELSREVIAKGLDHQKSEQTQQKLRDIYFKLREEHLTLLRNACWKLGSIEALDNQAYYHHANNLFRVSKQANFLVL
ncbi:unnamed protein product, partial [Protopolystoma xenopodis]